METKKISLIIVLSILSIFNIKADNQIEKARGIIQTFQKEIYSMLKYSPEELKGFKKEFQDYYKEKVAPRLLHISKHISPNAIHWVDLDWDQVPELIFWSEGLAPTAWGGKEFLFIIKVSKKGSSQIQKYIELENQPSRGKERYRYVRFRAHPNKNKGYNDFLGALFSYAVFGASGSTFVNYEIGWNRYNKTIFINKFQTSFAVGVDSEKE